MAQEKALITGASSGIGAVYSEKLARRGADLVIVARDRERLASMAERLNAQYGRAVTPLVANLSSAEGLGKVLATIRNDEQLSLVVNCAGLGPKAPVLQSDLSALGDMVQLNVRVLHDMTLAAATAFAVRKRGAIINIASAVALMPERFNGTYVAGKAFVLALTQSLAAELQSNGVRIQAVLPGFTRTELFDRSGVDINMIPEGMMMDATEMVDAALSGFDRGEVVTIPSLADIGLWENFETARHALAPYLSLNHAAPRYSAG